MGPIEARRVLYEHAPEGENWLLHSLQVARVAVRLVDAANSAGIALDREWAETHALLHDIGRSRTHGPLHGWSGFVLLRSLGHERAGRGCLVHWLKGRAPAELAASTPLEAEFIERVYASLDPPDWSLADSIMSVADASVRHSTIVSLADRHSDLLERYGDSEWMRRTCELGDHHAQHFADEAGRPVDEVLESLFGDTLDAPPPL